MASLLCMQRQKKNLLWHHPEEVEGGEGGKLLALFLSLLLGKKKKKSPGFSIQSRNSLREDATTIMERKEEEATGEPESGSKCE